MPSQPRIGLALAGGGPLGGIYELGALIALDEALEGVNLHELDVYVGVSSGAFVAANLANRLSTRELAAIFINGESDDHSFPAGVFLKPALGEYYQRARSLPGLMGDAVRRYLANPADAGVLAGIASLAQAIPTGLFENETMHLFLQDLYRDRGRSNDFRDLDRKLVVVATELDTGTVVKFGTEGFDHVPISRAVQASAALPGLYPPVEIDGRTYVDGALRRTLHASVALDEGVDLVFCVNPLVPFDASLETPARKTRLVNGGLPTVLAQTFRAIIHSRLRVGMASYGVQYAHKDVVLFEPERNDERMFFANVFSYANRLTVCQHAYRMTRRQLVRRQNELIPTLARHGISLREQVLADDDRHFTEALPVPSRSKRRFRSATLRELDRTLDSLQAWLDTAHGS